MNIIFFCFFVVLIWSQPWERHGNFSVRILLLQQICMISGCKHIAPEIAQAQQCPKSNATHTA